MKTYSYSTEVKEEGMVNTLEGYVYCFKSDGYLGVMSATKIYMRITGTVLLIHVNNRTRNRDVIMTNGLRYVQRKEPYKSIRVINGV